MAMLHLESFEGWSSSVPPVGKYTSVNTSTVSTTYGRNGSGVQMGSFNYIVKAIPARSTIVTGAAFKLSGTCRMWQFIDNANSTVQVRLEYNSNNTFTIFRNNTALAVTSETFAHDVWLYIEFKAVIGSGTSGSYELRVNGINKLSATGVNTQGSSTSNVTVVQYGTSSNANNCAMDDWYIADTLAGNVTDFAGDLKIEALFPSGAGPAAQFSRGGSTPAATNHQGVDEQGGHNSDVDYNYSSTVGQQDIFELQNLVTTSGAVKGVQANVVARKDDSNSRQVKPVLRMGSTNYGGTPVAVNSTYETITQCYDAAPDGTSWDLTKCNDLQAGYEVAA